MSGKTSALSPSKVTSAQEQESREAADAVPKDTLAAAGHTTTGQSALETVRQPSAVSFDGRGV